MPAGLVDAQHDDVGRLSAADLVDLGRGKNRLVGRDGDLAHQGGDVVGVAADNDVQNGLVHPGDRVRRLPRQRLAVPNEAFVGPDLNENQRGAVVNALAPAVRDLEGQEQGRCLDFGDLQMALQPNLSATILPQRSVPPPRRATLR